MNQNDLRKLFQDEGMSVADISNEFGVSVATVYRSLKRFDLLPKTTKPSKDELSKVYDRPGMSITGLAKHYSKSAVTIRQWLDEYGIVRKGHLQTCREVNAGKQANTPARDIFENDYKSHTIQELLRKYNTSPATLYTWINGFGLSRDHSESCVKAKAVEHADIRPGKEEFERLYNDHGNLKSVAEVIGCSYSHVRMLARQYDIEVDKPWRSHAEKTLQETLNTTIPDGNWIGCDRTIIAPYELDIVSEPYRIAIEYCGSYWHSEGFGQKPRDYHRRKMLSVNEAGYRLVTIFEWDDPAKVISLIRTMTGQTIRIHGRKTKPVLIESNIAADFHNTHHLSGARGGSYHIGLYHADTLVMVLTMGRPRFKSKAEWECVRMTSHSDYRVVGGASKLFKAFRGMIDTGSILTFADLRFGNGSVYEKCGFERLKDSPPNYWYFHKDRPQSCYSRVKFQKHKLVNELEHFDDGLTEYENMKANNWDRVWDCGNAVYVWAK